MRAAALTLLALLSAASTPRAELVFLTTGLHDDYHKVSDEVSKIEFDKMARVTRLIVEVGRAVASSPTRPR